MQPVLAAISYKTGLFIVVWVGFLLSLGFAKIQFRVMKEREMKQRLAQVEDAFRKAGSSETTDTEDQVPGSAVGSAQDKAAADRVHVVSPT